MTEPTKKPLQWACLIIGFYVSIAFIVYALRHPEMTDVQRLIHIIDVLMWR